MNYARLILDSLETHEAKQAWSEQHGADKWAQLVKDAEYSDTEMVDRIKTPPSPKRSEMTTAEKARFVAEYGKEAFLGLDR